MTALKDPVPLEKALEVSRRSARAQARVIDLENVLRTVDDMLARAVPHENIRFTLRALVASTTQIEG